MEAICDAKDQFPQLKALFIGDSEGEVPEFRKSKVAVLDIRPFLEAFPHLEVLQVWGAFSHYSEFPLTCAALHHDHLKSLIIETSDISQANIEQICSMDLPELEYFQLWFGRVYDHEDVVQPLRPILVGETYPQLKYLGLCSSEEASTLVQEVIGSPIMERLAVLDLKMGTLSDADIDPLLVPAPTTSLKVLDVTGNYLSKSAIDRLSQQPYQVIYEFRGYHEGEYYDEDEDIDELSNIDRHESLYE